MYIKKMCIVLPYIKADQATTKDRILNSHITMKVYRMYFSEVGILVQCCSNPNGRIKKHIKVFHCFL